MTNKVTGKSKDESKLLVINKMNLDITMDMTMSMEVLQCLKCFLQNRPDNTLFKPISVSDLHQMETWAFRHKWHHNPKMPLNDKWAVCFYQIGMVYQAHYLCLSSYVILQKHHCFLSWSNSDCEKSLIRTTKFHFIAVEQRLSLERK